MEHNACSHADIKHGFQVVTEFKMYECKHGQAQVDGYFYNNDFHDGVSRS